MNRKMGLPRGSLIGVALALAFAWLSAGPAMAQKVVLTDGRVLEGEFTMLSGVAVNPESAGGPGMVKPIEMLDNGLVRQFFPKRVVQRVEPAPPQRLERFRIDQPIAINGLPIASVGPIIRVTDFDKWGRRTFTMNTTHGAADVIQGLTVITPVWSRVEALQGGQPFLWDMRIATSSIPRKILSAVLRNPNLGFHPNNVDERLRLVRFYLQAERFQDAEAELKQVIADFPGVQGLEDQVKAIRQLGAQRLLSEVEVRRKAGQNRLASGILEKFPTDGVNGPTLQEVRDKIEEYHTLDQRGKTTIDQLDALLPKVKDAAARQKLKTVRDEIWQEMNYGTLDRLAPFRRLFDDPALLPEQKLALATSGWLLGPDEAIDNVQVALSLVETRRLIRTFMNEPQILAHTQLLESLTSQQAASARYVALILSHMKPPLETPAQDTPGFSTLEIPGIEGEQSVTYYVQLPPEYDPYVKYPCVVTLNGAGTTPFQQIDWWAGLPKENPAAKKSPDKEGVAPKNGAANAAPPEPQPDEKSAEKPGDKPAAGAIAVDLHGMRLGQATRQGYIVIAPAWTKPHQTAYEFSAREHAAVLGSLHDACRRFSIDTDRVFLSGHSMGGDAAWDIGLAHPDLWAGVIPIVATEGKVIPFYWPNAEHLPLYFISGELDASRTVANANDWDRYLKQPRGWDMTLVEFQGRGHENFSDEILRLFDWMGRKKRDFFPRDFTVATLRAWDNCFWCVELHDMPDSASLDPAVWPPPRGTHALAVKMKVGATNGLNVDVHGPKVTVWLSPEWVNFEQPIAITQNGARMNRGQTIAPSVPTLLDDARSRGDRQHPFWAKVE